MTDYTKSTNFATKDTLPPGSALKIVRGTEIDTEFNSISTAIATKADLASPALTGTPTAPTATGTDNSTKIATTAFVQNAATGFGFKNRIINGAMVISQRGTASVNVVDVNFSVDRFFGYASVTSKFTVQQNAGSVTPPVGFKNYLGATSSAATSLGAGDFYALVHRIEGFNIADLAWGTASAATITLSFQVRSSLTGTFGGALSNGSANRSYPFTYSIPVANTWTTISVTVAGDTTGTWATDNSTGISINFGLGVGTTYSGTAGAWAGVTYFSATGATSVVGTNGATFYITGVQLEKGSTATSFDYRPYGTEFMLCQRYLPILEAGSSISGYAINTTTTYCVFPFAVTPRVAPTGLSTTVSGFVYNAAGAGLTMTSIGFVAAGLSSVFVNPSVAAGLIAGNGSFVTANNDVLFTGCEL